MRICLNAGHCDNPELGYRHDPGAVGPSGLWEAAVTTRLVRALLGRLNRPGFFAYAKRQPGAHGLTALVARVNRSRPDVFVSVHCNAARSRAPQGAQVYYPWWPPGVRVRGKRLARCILERLPSNDSRWSRIAAARFYLLRKVIAPVRVLVEADFISHPQVEGRMRTAEWIDDVTAGLAAGLEEFLEVGNELAIGVDKETDGPRRLRARETARGEAAGEVALRGGRAGDR